MEIGMRFLRMLIKQNRQIKQHFLDYLVKALILVFFVQEIPPHVHQFSSPAKPSISLSVSNANATTASSANTPSLGTVGTGEGREFAPSFAYINKAPDVQLREPSVALSLVESAGGSGIPHSNMQPYIGIPHIICLQGIFPPRN